MKKRMPVLLITCMLMIVNVVIVSAQSSNQLELGLSRDFGYGGFGNDIQGLFTLRVKNAPVDLSRVDFFIDFTLMGVDTEAPFSLQFNTDSYPLGEHTLSVSGYLSSGEKINSENLQVQFVSPGTGMQSVTKIIVPIFGLILIIGLAAVFLPLVLSKGKLSSLPLGTPRNYGIGGGAICPKCDRPFPLRLWWINLGFNKIDRCPYCGKWSFLRPRSLADLRAAEAAELAQAQPENPVPTETDAEKLHKDLEDSKYQDV